MQFDRRTILAGMVIAASSQAGAHHPEVFRRSFALIDLRVLMNDDADFANPIEPSEKGRMKLANAIKRFVEGEATSRVIS
jgi:hypothetical protein